MLLSLSNLSFVGFNYTALKQLPTDLGLEIFYEFGDNFHWERVMKELYANRPLQSLSIHGPCIGINLADENDTHYPTLYKTVFAFAAKWKADFVVVHTNEEFNGKTALVRKRVHDRLQELLALSQQHQIQLLIENVGLKDKNTLLFGWEEYLELLSSLPAAGALLDIGHAHINKWNLPTVIEQLGNRIMAYHLHDNHGLSDDHLPIGNGTIDLNPLFSAILAYTPEATLVFEYANVNLQTALANIETVNRHYL
ncbi:MAG TPA: sugar phosphate isomerase/epimerase [Negativicutes bacterium]|jgi:sugar phosphate isomerase/epimerase